MLIRPHATTRTPWKLELRGYPLAEISRRPEEFGRHAEDEFLTHMLPDENGELLVQAHCGHHYVMQSQDDLLAGVEAQCVEPNCRWRLMLERRAA